MRIKYFSDDITKYKVIKNLIEFASKTGVGLNRSYVEIHVLQSTLFPYKMTAYKNLPKNRKVNKNTKQLAVIRFGLDDYFPMSEQSKFKSIKNCIDLNSWEESIVFMAAYVLRKLWQYQNWGACSNMECEKAGIRALNQWRKLQ